MGTHTSPPRAHSLIREAILDDFYISLGDLVDMLHERGIKLSRLTTGGIAREFRDTLKYLDRTGYLNAAGERILADARARPTAPRKRLEREPSPEVRFYYDE